jgi:hypothetical protein
MKVVQAVAAKTRKVFHPSHPEIMKTKMPILNRFRLEKEQTLKFSNHKEVAP